MNPAEPLPLLTLEDYELRFADRQRLDGVLTRWARERGSAPALIEATSGRTLSWAGLERATAVAAAELLRRGWRKGDFLLTQLPLTLEHVVLEYACFRIGAIAAPLDLRLTAAEVARAAAVLAPRGFAAPVELPPFDFRPQWSALREAAPGLELALVAGPAIAGAEALSAFLAPAFVAAEEGVELPAELRAALSHRASELSADDGALVIFTTGSTGSPKPALLSHRNITVQNMCLCAAFFGGDSGTRILVNLPPSHVGGQTEELMSALFGGGTAILVPVFDAARSLAAIAAHRAEILGQIPVMFNLEWMLKDYTGYDLSSLRFAAYGGNAVSRPFLERMARMAPVVGTGLGLTEAAGFCTYVEAEAGNLDPLLAGLGQAMPIYPCSVRGPMRPDGLAGEELAAGEVGHVCFRGPQTFLGYVGDPDATARTVSRDGYLYTGDLGSIDAAGLHLAGREKWVIKSMGYQIFPGDIEAHLAALDGQVAHVVAVGVEHAVASEAVVAVVEKRPGATLTVRELERHARSLPSYMRPRHYILLEPGAMPINRVAKPDVERVRQMARAAVAELRAAHRWDHLR